MTTPQVAVPTTTTSTTTTTVAPAQPWLVASSRLPGQRAQIIRVHPDGTGRSALTSDQSVEHHWPRPSPDGSKVLFYRAAPGSGVNDIDTNELWVMAPDGSGTRRLIADGGNGFTRQGHAEWSPDGTRIVMAAGDATSLQLWTTDANGGDPRTVADRRNPTGAVATALDPSWGPDGNTLVYTACPTDLVACFPWNYEVYRRDLRTGVEVRLTYDTYADFDPYVSPDGGYVVWLRNTGGLGLPPWGLYRAPLGTTPATPVAVLDDGNVNTNAHFSPDGTRLVLSRTVLGGAATLSLATVAPDGTGLRSVPGAPAGAEEHSAAWLP